LPLITGAAAKLSIYFQFLPLLLNMDKEDVAEWLKRIGCLLNHVRQIAIIFVKACIDH
jgi:hypothetical protein